LRHSYIDRPRRIRAPRATPPSRTRFLPAVVALPVVAVLWVTVGLPVLSQVTGAGGSNRLARSVVFAAQATGTGGGTGGASSVPQTEAATIVSEKVLAAYHAEVAKRARARARAAAKVNAIDAKLALPQPARSAMAPDSATLVTADQAQRRLHQLGTPVRARATRPAQEAPATTATRPIRAAATPQRLRPIPETPATPAARMPAGQATRAIRAGPAIRATWVTSAGAPAAARRCPRLRLRRRRLLLPHRLRRPPRLRLPLDLRPLRHPRRAPCRHPRTYRRPAAAAHMARLQPVMRSSTRSQARPIPH
jgi:hypothetical protein